MIIGIAVLWAGYTIGLWGYVTVRRYCIGFQDLLSYRYPQSMGGGTLITSAATTAAGSASSVVKFV